MFVAREKVRDIYAMRDICHAVFDALLVRVQYATPPMYWIVLTV